jgi:glycosyltransferase involved in cell wall biosynthesis
MNLSILIPLLNEEESLNELYNWIIQVMQSHNYSYEIIFLDDGVLIIHGLSGGFAQQNPNVGRSFHENFGKSQALHAGFAKAKVMSLLLWMLICKNSPEEIPGLYDMIVNGKVRFGFGLEKKRYDSVVAKNLPSKLFNWAARKTSGVIE